jgi:hypothetical protein
LADQLGIHDLRDAIVGNRLNEIMSDLSMPVMCTFKSANVEHRSHSKFRLGFHLSRNDYYRIQHSDLPFKGNLIYTITGPNSGEKLAHSFHAFLDYVHTISKNSLNLYQILTKNHEGIKESIARFDVFFHYGKSEDPIC